MTIPPRGRVIRLQRITRAMVQADRDTIFVFGDNMKRAGYGGQAGQMRGEPIGWPERGDPLRWIGDWPGRTADPGAEAARDD
jgi:hypothetical protein